MAVEAVMRTIAALALLVVVIAGCGSSPKPPAAAPRTPIATAGCPPPRLERALVRAPFSGESGVYRAGPLTLAIGYDLAQVPRQPPAPPSGSDAIALITGRRPVLVRVESVSRARLSLQFAPAYTGDPDPEVVDHDVVRFPVCDRHARRFLGGITFGGSGCVRLMVQAGNEPASFTWIPIGNSLGGCPTAHGAARLPDSALPFLGVACGQPNSIACERVGVGVTTQPPASLVVVSLAGRLVALSPPASRQAAAGWLGYLQGVSLRSGPLRIPVARSDTRWFGSPEVHPRVRVTAFFADGQVATISGSVPLHPGFG
jgi:hypothetical protein